MLPTRTCGLLRGGGRCMIAKRCNEGLADEKISGTDETTVAFEEKTIYGS